jgi:hypothetical protein
MQKGNEQIKEKFASVLSILEDRHLDILLCRVLEELLKLETSSAESRVLAMLVVVENSQVESLGEIGRREEQKVV